MKWNVSLGILLLAGVLSGCNMPTGSQAAPVTPAAPAAPAEPPTAIPASAEVSATTIPCIESGTEDAINARLQGPGSSAILCPGAVFELSSPVVYSAPRQQVYTQGLPTDDTRATLRIISPEYANAVYMRDLDGVVLSHVIVDGNRSALGPKGGKALVQAGGYASGQFIRGNRIMNPRSWSALHLIEGFSTREACRNAVVEDNEIGPAGTSDEMLWADGISLACSDSTVRNNVITDATDGGIVIFGAPGSIIEGNTVRAQTQTMLGGINMVDDESYYGSYLGTIVRNNVIDASGAVIRIGLGMGTRVWTCLPPNDMSHVISGGTVTGNTLRGAHMQYGYIVDGVLNWTVTGNIDEATHSGKPGQACGSLLASPPAGFLIHGARSEGTFQPEFTEAQLDLSLWAITSPRPGE